MYYNIVYFIVIETCMPVEKNVNVNIYLNSFKCEMGVAGPNWGDTLIYSVNAHKSMQSEIIQIFIIKKNALVEIPQRYPTSITINVIYFP